jgi:hypothetical protein
MIAEPKRKWRPNSAAPLRSVAGLSVVPLRGYGDFLAKRCGFNGDHGRRSKRIKTGAKTYDKTSHILVMRPTGKTVMVRLEA